MSDTDTAWSGPARGSVLVVGVGAVQGLGAAIARRFAAGGYPVAVAGRNAEKLETVVAALKASGASAVGVVGDAAAADDVRRFVAAAEQLAPLAVAVHNAGGNRPAPFLQVTEASFEQHWREHALGGAAGAAAQRRRQPDLHRRLGQPARQGQFRPVRGGQGGGAGPGPELGPRIRTPGRPCWPRGH